MVLISLVKVGIEDGLKGLTEIKYTVNNVEVSNGEAILKPGESLVMTATYTVTAADVAADSVPNSAKVEGTPEDPDNPEEPDPEKPPVTDEDEEDVPKAAIQLVKTADLTVYKVGDTITYTFEVTNTGNVTLTDVKVTDPMFPAGIKLDKTTLAPGEIAIGTAGYTTTQADVDAGKVYNRATATGTPPGDTTPPEDTDDEEVPAQEANPAINLVKKADLKVYKLGETITYTFEVTNNGNVTLNNVKVTDPMFPDGIKLDKTTLAPGEVAIGSASYTTTQADVDNGKVINTATATGTPPDGQTPPEDTDDETVPGEEQKPAIDLLKTADKTSYKLGDIITYTFKVTNTGNVTLSQVTVTDPMFPAGILLDKTTLAPGEIAIGTASYKATEADVKAGNILNKATATGTPPNDLPKPTADDEVTIPVDPVKPTQPSKQNLVPRTGEADKTALPTLSFFLLALLAVAYKRRRKEKD